MRIPMLLLMAILFCSVSMSSQTVVTPDSKHFQFKLEPFSATYSQMGSTLAVETSLSLDSKMYQINMSMPNVRSPSRLITDVIGLEAETGAVVYRDFHLLLPSWSYNRMEVNKGSIHLASYGEHAVKLDSALVGGKVFDGTFGFWLLSGINDTVDSFMLNRWKQSPKGLEVGLSPTFTVEGREMITINEVEYACAVIAVAAAPGVKIVSYVSEQAPYLIKQVYLQGDNPGMEVLRLQKMK